MYCVYLTQYYTLSLAGLGYQRQAHSFQTRPIDPSYILLFSPIMSLVILPGVISVSNAIFFHSSLCLGSALSGVLPLLL